MFASACGLARRLLNIFTPTFVLFVRGGELGRDYLRFIENQLRDAYDFTGTPIRIRTRNRH